MTLLAHRCEKPDDDGRTDFEHLFSCNGWQGIWRNGPFDYHHYRSGAHEDLGVPAAMEKLMEGRTTLVVAHRLLVFKHGNIAEEGTHASLLRRKSGIYPSLFERQALELTKGIESEGLIG